MRAYRTPVQPLPDINLDEFKICIYKLWSLGELIFYNSAMAFGTSSHSNFHGYSTPGVLMHLTFGVSSYRGTADIFVFVTILITVRRRRTHGYPGIPSILDTVVRDATGYFLLISSTHFVSVLFVFVAPVGGV